MKTGNTQVEDRILMYHVFTDGKDLWTPDYRVARKLYNHWKKANGAARLYKEAYERAMMRCSKKIVFSRMARSHSKKHRAGELFSPALVFIFTHRETAGLLRLLELQEKLVIQDSGKNWLREREEPLHPLSLL